MAGQETLTPAEGGIWARYRQDGHINHGAWLRAVAEGGFVGTCRLCGDYLIPQSPDEYAGRLDYEARCRATGCGYSMCAPGGRLTKNKRGG